MSVINLAKLSHMAVVLTISVLLVVIILLATGGFTLERLRPRMLSAQTSTNALVIEKLRTVRELHTSVASIQTVMTSSQINKILGVKIGSTKLLYIAVGRVRAGVDLEKLDESCVTISGDEYVLTLPRAEILDAKIDLKQSFVYDVQQSLVFAPDALGLHDEAQKQALEQIVEAAVKCGVLELAEAQAVTVIDSLIDMSGLRNVVRASGRVFFVWEIWREQTRCFKLRVSAFILAYGPQHQFRCLLFQNKGFHSTQRGCLCR